MGFSEAPRIYVVEDHPLMRQIICDFISRGPAFRLAGAARTGEEALEQLGTTDAALVLIDMSLPGMNGADLVVEIRARWPGLPCLMLSGHTEAQYVRRALEVGAHGYVLKGDPYELAGAIQQVLRGEVYLSEPVRNLG